MIYIALQLIMFIPFYLIWRNDCKTIGKSNLAVSLVERFVAWYVWEVGYKGETTIRWI